MADWWINPSNATGDGLSRATGWPNFSYATAGNGVVAGDTLKVAALAPTDISGNRQFSLVQGSQTINYTGDSLVGVVAAGDMIAKSAYITTLLDVPYVLTNVTASALTISVNYQGATEVVSNLVKINAYQNIAAGTTVNLMDAGGIIGGFLETDDTVTPTGISWFDRLDGASTTVITGVSYWRIKIARFGFYRYAAQPFYLSNAFGIEWDEIYTVGMVHYQGLGTGAIVGSYYNSSNIYNNYCGGGPCTDGTCKNLISIGSNGAGVPRIQYGNMYSTSIANLYVYGNTTYGIVPVQNIIIGNLHSARNGDAAIGITGYALNNIVYNVSELSGSLHTTTETYNNTQMRPYLTVMNNNGVRYRYGTGGYLYRNTTDAYNVECLEFRSVLPSTEYRTYIVVDKLYAECIANTAMTLSFIMKCNAAFANGVVQYSVWFEQAQIVDWTSITLTTYYKEFPVTIASNLIPRNGVLELRIRVKATAGYAYLAERDGKYVKIIS